MSGATPEGTGRYARRIGADPAHFRAFRGWTVSSIGLGTYLGEMDAACDRRYTAAALRAFERGCNLFDTAINYRYQRSERSIGEALKEIPRDEVIVATKAGYPSIPGRMDTFAARHPGIIGPGDVVGNVHCMTPRYLEHQLHTSLRNLGIETIDIFYLHNPETQLSEVPRKEFLRRIRAAFEYLEAQAKAGLIQLYGTATWNGYRADPREDEFLCLEELVAVAREVGGQEHRFRAVQLPVNLAMMEAAGKKHQPFGRERLTLLEAAGRFGLMVCSSASLLQGQLARQTAEPLNAAWPALGTPAQRSLQFVRSLPGLTCALVGMSDPAHVEENLALARHPPDEKFVAKCLG
jgi:aryl-alcohol dehydrogenase-like predicted oxidoreductase